MSDFGQKTLAGHRLMKAIAETKQRQESEPIEWTKPDFVHELHVDYEENKPGEIQLASCVCKCGFVSEWKSFSEAIHDYENHARNLWEVRK